MKKLDIRKKKGNDNVPSLSGLDREFSTFAVNPTMRVDPVDPETCEFLLFLTAAPKQRTA